jgi:hypothetical protein
MKEETTVTRNPDTHADLNAEMKRSDEPLGIIISRGSREEPTPIFSTYVWGPAPDPADGASKAA